MERLSFIEKISSAFSIQSIVVILGARQAGKTTLARQYTDKEIRSSLCDISWSKAV